MKSIRSEELEGTVAVITGGGRGIGRALALAMSGAGANVVIASRTREEVEKVAVEISGSGGRAMACVMDVRRWEQVRHTMDEVVTHMGPVDVLVNNAGVVTPVGPIFKVNSDEWEQALATNLLGVFFCTKAVLDTMIPRSKGKILNLVSGMGQRVFPGFSAYSVSKAGLIHFTRVVAEEVREYGISVNAIDPGIVDTGMHEQLRNMPPGRVGRDMHARLVQYKKEGLLRPPEMIAKVIVTLLTGGELEGTGEVIHLGEYQKRYGYK